MNSDKAEKDPQTGLTRQRTSLRRSRIIFIAVIILTALAVVWPGQAIFSSPTPLIFGFPLSFAWIIFWVIVGFLALLGLYLSDSHDDELKPGSD